MTAKSTAAARGSIASIATATPSQSVGLSARYRHATIGLSCVRISLAEDHRTTTAKTIIATPSMLENIQQDCPAPTSDASADSTS